MHSLTTIVAMKNLVHVLSDKRDEENNRIATMMEKKAILLYWCTTKKRFESRHVVLLHQECLNQVCESSLMSEPSVMDK